MAIVRAIAAAHGATVTASARPGGGMAIEVGFEAGGRLRPQSPELGAGPRAAIPAHGSGAVLVKFLVAPLMVKPAA